MIDHSAVALVLATAADRIERPGAWTRGAVARDELGDELADSTDPTAVCHCAAGSIHAACNKLGFGDGEDIFRQAVRRVAALAGRQFDRWNESLEWLTDWNDAPGRTQGEVVELLRRASRMAVPA